MRGHRSATSGVPWRGPRRGSLGRRVVLGAVAVGVLAAVAAAVVVITALELRSAQDRQTGTFAGAQADTVQALNGFVDQETGLRGFLLTGQDRFLQPYDAATVTVPVVLGRLQAATGEIPAAAGPLTGVREAHQSWTEYATGQLTLARAGHRDQAVGVVGTGRGKRLFDALRGRVATLQEAVRAGAADNQAQVGRLQRRLVALLVLSLLLLAAVSGVGVRILLAAFISPVQRLAAAARKVADGDLSAPIQTRGAPEIAALGRDVAAMRDRLLADARATEQAMAALEQQGPAAAALREALTPAGAGIDGLVVAGRMDAADGVLAGDWYDLIALSDHRLALVLGDVSGHGPRSAVLALRLKHTIAAALRTGAGPSRALTTISRTLVDVPPEMFATVLVLTVDTADNELVYANAGHPAALLLAGGSTDLNPGERARTVTATGGQEVTWVGLPSTGPLLSPVVASWAWGEAAHTFGPGDTLIGYTDGLLEARDEAGEQFGLTRLLDVLADHDLDNGPRLLDALAAAVVRHTTARRDDQTLIYAHRQALRTAPAGAGNSR